MESLNEVPRVQVTLKLDLTSILEPVNVDLLNQMVTQMILKVEMLKANAKMRAEGFYPLSLSSVCPHNISKWGAPIFFPCE
jgi:hypothetical protein